MELMDYKVVNERFTALRKLAQKGEALPEAFRDSAADVEAYETCCGIFRDLSARLLGKNELRARGNLARARYVAQKREELLQTEIYNTALEAQKRASQLGAALRKKWTGTPLEMIDAVCDYIAALEGTDVGAKIICSRMKDVLLGASDAAQAEQKKKPLPQKSSTPTLEEVRAYFREKHFSSNPEAFFNHFESSGWVRAKGVRIKDWKAAARSWELREAQFAPKRGGKKQSVYSSDASYDLEAYARTAIGLREVTSSVSPDGLPPSPLAEKARSGGAFGAIRMEEETA